MSEPCEFVFVPRKLTVRNSVTQSGNNTSEMWIVNSEQDSIECWRNGEFGDGSSGNGVQQGEHRDTRDFLGTGTSSRLRCQYQVGKEARECCNNAQNKANRCFCTSMLIKSQDWCSTGHGSRTPGAKSANSVCAHLSRYADLVRTHTHRLGMSTLWLRSVQMKWP